MKQMLFQRARGVSQPSAHLTTPPVRGATGFARCLAAAAAVAMVAAGGKADAQLPPGWTDTDIGSPSQPGSASFSAGDWSVSGGGGDIWNAADQFNFCYTNPTSYAVIIAQVTSVEATDPWAKAGVMFRDDTTAGSMFAMAVATSGNGVNFQWRNSTGGQCGYSQVGGVNAPVWVKLVHNGNDFAAYYSPDGAGWTSIGPDETIPMISTGLAGLAVTAHNDALLNTSTFSNVTVSNTVALPPPAFGVFRQLWSNLDTSLGNNLDELTNTTYNPNWPNNPDLAYTKTYSSFETEANTGMINYGQRLRAFVVPPTNGNYTFSIASDDTSDLFVSTDETPAGAALVAYVSSWTPFEAWYTLPGQQSAPIALQGGCRYYVEAIMQQGGGGDNLSVGWQLPSGVPELPLTAISATGTRLIPYVGTNNPAGIFVQPTNTTVTEGQNAVFSLLVTNQSSVTYRWRLNGANLAGASASKPAYTISNVSLTLNNGQLYSCVVSNSLGAITSAPVLLSVLPDSVPPTVLRAFNLGTTNVQVVFSKPVEAASAANQANYVFTNSLAVTGASLGADNATVTLTTGPLVYGSNYCLVINRVRDRASVPNTIATNTLASFVASPYVTQDIGNSPLASVLTTLSNGVSITAAGSDIGGSQDQFSFNFQVRTGDFDLSVSVTGLSPSDVWAKAGLMARETLDAGSRFAASLATPAMNGDVFEWRDPASSTSSSSGSFPANYPNTWLRLKRAGSVFTGFASYDGQTWVQLGSSTIAMPSQIYVGFAVDSHIPGQPTTAQFGPLTNVTYAVAGTVLNPHDAPGPSSRTSPIAISEIMYKPAPRTDGRNLEYVELYNSNPWFYDISGYQLVCADINYTFPPGTTIPGGAYLVVAAAPADVQSVYATTGVWGPYTGSLKNSEKLQLLDEHGAVLLTVPYSNVNPWPVAADGTGHSLVLAYPTYGEGDPRAWDISDVVGGSPGQMEAFRPSPLRNVVINEFLAHTDPPDYDYIELYNHSTNGVDISGCILTDDPTTNKFVIPPGTIIPARGFVFYSETNMNFALNAVGESIYLKNPDQSRVLDAVQFAAQQNGVATGRWPDGANSFYRLSAKTPGGSNAPILLSDVVINELMYDPISGNDDDQYVELYNKGTNTVNLAGWQFTSGITFTFPSATLSPNGYLVVGRNLTNLFAKYPNLNSANTLGNYSGKLSHNGEYLALTMPAEHKTLDGGGNIVTNIIDIVVNDLTYGTGGRWGQWSAGGGSSLELIDPNSNNRLAANWADSDETQKSVWTNIECTGVLDNGANYDPSIDYAQIGLLDVGECLVDNVEVRAGTAGANLVLNPDFETGDLSNWTLQGDHVRSSLENSGYLSSHSLHLRCSDRVWTGANSCELALNSNSLAEGQTATLRFKARWLHGWPEVLLRLNGNWLEATGPMPVPRNLGTPGLPNSRLVANAGPAIYEVTHSPAVPAANQPVVVTARVHDPDGVQTLGLYYRLDPAANYTTVTMKDDGTDGDAIAGDGLFSATIPGQSASTITAFYLAATDKKGAATRFPALLNDYAPARECVVMFGDGTPGGSFGVYHLWITQTNATRWSELSDLSNESHDCTIVNGNRVIYDAQARFAGSPYHQGFDTPYGNLCHYKWIFPDDDAFLGATSFNKIHQPGNGAGDDTSLQREQTANTFLRALGVPWLNRRFVAVYVNGNRRGTLMEDAQTPDSDVVKEHFPNDADGWLYKMQPWFEFGPEPQGYSIPFANESWCNLMPYTTTGGVKKMARYRYNFLIRRTPVSDNDFSNVFSLVDAANSYGTPNYVANMENMADMENWMRVFAANHAAGNWDSFGAQNAQNLYGYIGALDIKYSLLMFDFNITLGNSGSWGPGQNLFAVNGSDPNTANIYNEPTFRRMYWRALEELVNGPLNVANSGPLLDAKYNAFVANGLNVENPSSSIKPWLTQAQSSIAAQIAAENATSFTVNPAPAVTNDVAYLTGTAPVNVQTIWINGAPYPLQWTSVSTWMAAVPLQQGNNPFSVVGVDTHGQPISGDSNNVAVVYNSTVPSPVGQVVINEIMFNPAVPEAEYVELYNASSKAAYDLSGWKLKGLAYTFPPGSLIGTNGFLVLAANRAAFAAAYGATNPVFDTFGGTFQPGEIFSLIQPGSNGSSNVTVAAVQYDSVPPWPTPIVGASLQLIDPRQDNWRVGNWATVSTTAGYALAQWVFVTTNVPATSSRIYIYLNSAGDVYVDDASVVGSAGTNLLANGAFESPLSGTWNLTANFTNSALSTTIKHSSASSLHVVASAAGTGSGNAIYQDISPSLTNGTNYTIRFWYLQSTNGGPLTVRLSSSANPATVNIAPAPLPVLAPTTPDATNSPFATLAAFPPVWINELQADNLTGITNSAGQRTAWLELYNPSTNKVSLNGLYLANNYTNLTQWAFPTNASINAGQFKVIFADGQTSLSTTNELHTSFVLPSGSGSLALTRLTAIAQLQVLDYVSYTNIATNYSYGSFPDGQSFTRQAFYHATPGVTNDGVSVQTPSFIPYTTARAVYTQNFNSLPNPGAVSVNSDNPVTINGITYSLANPFDFGFPVIASGNVGGLGIPALAGWYGMADPAASVGTRFGATDGDQTTGGVISFGLPGSSNRAVGLLATGSTGYTGFGAKFINQTPSTLNSITFQFTGEVWRQSDKPKTLQFYYYIDPTATAPFTASYTAFLPALNVSFPTVPADVGGVAVDGTAPANQIGLGVTNQVITNWPPGAALWLVWEMTDATGKAQGLAIDNLSFSADQLPSTTNTAPTLAPIPNQSIYANTMLTLTASATDTDQPPQLLTFSLDSGAPAGASITSGGVFTWTPTAAQAPGTYPTSVIVTDSGVPPMSATNSFNVVVYRPNTPPVLTVIPRQTVYATTLLTFTASATDTDQPPQTLTFSLGTGALTGASITSGGVFTWTPTAAQAPSTNTISVIVQDNGQPQMSATNSFKVVVYRPNTPPVLGALSDQMVYATTLLTFTASATDTDQPPQNLTFSLGTGAPTGASITSGGVFTWTPTAAQAPSTNTISVIVQDSGVPQMSATNSISVVVYRPNTPPVLSAISNQTVYANTLLTFTASATDTDKPPQLLTFSLGTGAPSGASITTNGVFRWTPTSAQAPSTNNLSVIVEDSGLPPMSATNSFSAVVLQPPALILESATSLSDSFTVETDAVIDTVQETITTSVKSTARFYRLRSQTAVRILSIQVQANQVTLTYH
jgi:hypothetical protein